MAAEFMSEDFLLQTETARVLYHEYAEKMPIYDYHCHLPADEIAADRIVVPTVTGGNGRGHLVAVVWVLERFGDRVELLRVEQLVLFADRVPGLDLLLLGSRVLRGVGATRSPRTRTVDRAHSGRAVGIGDCGSI